MAFGSGIRRIIAVGEKADNGRWWDRHRPCWLIINRRIILVIGHKRILWGVRRECCHRHRLIVVWWQRCAGCIISQHLTGTGHCRRVHLLSISQNYCAVIHREQFMDWNHRTCAWNWWTGIYYSIHTVLRTVIFLSHFTSDEIRFVLSLLLRGTDKTSI